MQLNTSDQKYFFGRKIMLASAVLYCATRAATYLPNPDRNVPKAMEFFSLVVPVWVWALLWVVAAVLCLIDLFRGQGRRGISTVVGLMIGWGAMYLISYIDTVASEGLGSREWSTFGHFTFAGGMILGLLIKVGALKRRGEHE